MTFLILVFASSLFIMGWYKITRHHIVVMPDGSQQVEGEIFKYVSFFIEEINGVKAWQYKEEQLEEKFTILTNAKKSFADKLQIAPERMSLLLKNGQKLDAAERKFIEDVCQVRTFVNADVLFLFLDMPVYVLPKWVRFPLISCPMCMASVYGTAIWWTFVHLQKDYFQWATDPVLTQWTMWPFFCISLSFVNYLWTRKIDF